MKHKNLSSSTFAHLALAGVQDWTSEERFTQKPRQAPYLIVKPQSETELAAVLTQAQAEGHPLRILGVYGDHLGGVVLDMSHFNQLHHIDHSEMRVTCGAFISLMDLNHALAQYGLSLDHSMPELTLLGASLANGAMLAAQTPFAMPKLPHYGYRTISTGGPFEHSIHTGGDVTVDLIWRSFGQLGIPTQLTLPVRPAPEASIALHVPELAHDIGLELASYIKTSLFYDVAFLRCQQEHVSLDIVHRGTDESCTRVFEDIQDLLGDYDLSTYRRYSHKDDIQSHLETIWSSAEGLARLWGERPHTALAPMDMDQAQRAADLCRTGQMLIYDIKHSAMTTLSTNPVTADIPWASSVIYPPAKRTRSTAPRPIFDMLKAEFDPEAILNPAQ